MGDSRKNTRPWLRRTIFTTGIVLATSAAVVAVTTLGPTSTPGLPGVITQAYAYTMVAPTHFNAIDMTGPVYGWGTGYDKSGHFKLIKTMDGGQAWNKVELPVSPPTYDVTLNEIGQPGYVTAYFLNGSDGYLSWIDDSKQLMTVLHTTDGGQHWQVSKTKVSVYADAVSNVDFINQKQGWILATSTVGTESEQKFLYRTSNGGKSWAQVADSLKFPYQGTINSLGFTNQSHGWFGTGDMASNTVSLYRTSDGGATWNSVHVPTPTLFNKQSNAIATTTPIFSGKAGTFVTTYSKLENGEDNDYLVIYHTTDDGKTWHTSINSLLKNIPTSALYMGIENGWVINHGTVYRTVNSGQTWLSVSKLPGSDFTKYPVLSELTFVNQQTGWLLLQSTDFQHSILLKTNNGGHSWLKQ